MADDFSELAALAKDIEQATHNLPKYLRKSLEVSARKVKDTARQSVAGRSMMGQASAAIDYDLEGATAGTSEMSAEIGYNRGIGAGKIGNLVEFGAPNAREVVLSRGRGGLKWVPKPGGKTKPLAPGNDLLTALNETEADFERGIALAVDDALREVGL